MKDAVDILNKKIEKLEAENNWQKAAKNSLASRLTECQRESAEFEAQRQEDADLIEAQKREIEALHGIREEAERLREEVEQLQWTIKDMTVYSTGKD